MTLTSPTSQIHAARDRKLTQMRRQAEARVSRERTRNAKLAFVCCAVLAAGPAAAFYFGALPSSASVRLTAVEKAAQRFAATRTGQVLFTSVDGAVCREVKFNNDTGRFSSGTTTSCEALTENEEPTPPPTAGDRFLSLRDGFAKK